MERYPRILQEGKIPIYIWTNYVEDGAMVQAINLSNLPFAFSHIALMPDVHQGYGMPIGGVLAAEGFIVPNAVGVDIGCGVRAVKTDVKNIESCHIKKIFSKTSQIIPQGFAHHHKPQEWDGFSLAPDIPVIRQELPSAKCQMGTLGSGNHFYSIEKGNDGFIWLMVHSGSRNFGLKTASFYNKVAKTLNNKLQIVPREYDLAPLPLDSSEGGEYFEAMDFCLKFAKANRTLIMDRFFKAFAAVTGAEKALETVDIHHNYAALETHKNKELTVHRKGATRAGEGKIGIIPGSMGTPSYIVQGLGNPDSFCSCSHGCGRTMSRREANRIITRQDADRSMENIVFSGWRGDFSEAPAAYKNIEEVMTFQSNLVKPLIKLTPVGVMKA